MTVTMSSDAMYTNLQITCYNSSGTQLRQYSHTSQGSVDKTIDLSNVSYVHIYLYQGVGGEGQDGGHSAYIKINSIS